MKTKPLKSFDELSIIKDKINNSLNHSTNSTDLFQAEEAETANNYKELSVEDRSKWAAVFDLLEDHFFSDLASGLHKKISSKKYSTVTSVLTYPTKADSIISQSDLDIAHGLAYFIKTSVNSGSIKYTNARIPGAWRIAGNPGTKR